MSRVLIAGAGYVGTALAELLAARGHEVVGLRRERGALPEGVTWVRGDLERPESLPKASFDALVFAAGPSGSDEASYRRTYLVGLQNALDAFPAERVLFLSSTAVYAQSGGEWVDETSPTQPTHFSGSVLLEAEKLLGSRRPDAVVLRLGGIYGPMRASMVDRALTGVLEYRSDHDVFVNRIHRDDCAAALAHLLVLARPEPLYLGVDDAPCPRRELAEWLAERVGCPPPRAIEETTPARRGQSNKRCSNARLRASGWAPRFPSYREGYGAILEAARKTHAAGAHVR